MIIMSVVGKAPLSTRAIFAVVLSVPFLLKEKGDKRWTTVSKDIARVERELPLSWPRLSLG